MSKRAKKLSPFDPKNSQNLAIKYPHLVTLPEQLIDKVFQGVWQIDVSLIHIFGKAIGNLDKIVGDVNRVSK